MLASRQRPDDGDDSRLLTARTVAIVVILGMAVAILMQFFVIATYLLAPPTEEGYQAGARVTTNSTAGTITVTWTSNQNVHYLMVSTDCTTDINTRLTTVGDNATATGCNGTHHVTVTGHADDAVTVIVNKDVQV